MSETQKKQTQKKQRVSVYKSKSTLGAKRHAKAVARAAQKWARPESEPLTFKRRKAARTPRGAERALRREPLKHGSEMISPTSVPRHRELELMGKASSASFKPAGRVLPIQRKEMLAVAKAAA